MAKNIFAGVDNVAKKAKNIYVGVNNKARKVKEVYAGVGGVARKVWPNNLIPDDRYQSVTSIGVKASSSSARIYFYPTLDPTFVTYPILRCVMKFSLFDTSGAIGNTEDGRQYIDGRGFVEYGYLYGSEYDSSVCIKLGYEKNSSGNLLFNVTYGKRATPPYFVERFTSYSSENMILDNIYTIDFSNNYATYIDSQRGYYSNPANRYMGSLTSSKISPPSNDMYSSNWYYTGIEFGLGLYLLGKVYSVKFYKNNTTLIRDYVPCYRISDGYIGMFDMVNRVFLECTDFGYTPVKSDTTRYVIEE